MANALTKNPLFKYLRESKEELEKVTWPTRKEVYQYSLIVSIFSLAMAAYFGLLDWLVQLGLEQLVSLAG